MECLLFLLPVKMVYKTGVIELARWRRKDEISKRRACSLKLFKLNYCYQNDYLLSVSFKIKNAFPLTSLRALVFELLSLLRRMKYSLDRRTPDKILSQIYRNIRLYKCVALKIYAENNIIHISKRFHFVSAVSIR